MRKLFLQAPASRVGSADPAVRLEVARREWPAVEKRAADVFRDYVYEGGVGTIRAYRGWIACEFQSVWGGLQAWKCIAELLEVETRSTPGPRDWAVVANVAAGRILERLPDLTARWDEIKSVDRLSGRTLRRLWAKFTEEDEHEYTETTCRRLLRQMGLPALSEDEAVDLVDDQPQETPTAEVLQDALWFSLSAIRSAVRSG